MAILFRDFMASEAIVPNLLATNKHEAIVEMVGQLVAAHALTADQQEGVVKALLDRERICTTAIGDGMAIPHGKGPGVNKLIGAFAHSFAGVPFDAADGKPVRLFFLLLSNRAETAQHLAALAYITRCLRDDLFRTFLLNAHSQKEIMEVFAAADKQAWN